MLVTVKVYVCVVGLFPVFDKLTIGFDIKGSLKPVEGDHE
jgi:hypothetical protein